MDSSKRVILRKYSWIFRGYISVSIFFTFFLTRLNSFPYTSTQIEIDGAGGGLQRSPVKFGDFDNDGDLDILVAGYTTATNLEQLRIYLNNGNGTFNAAQIEVDGASNGLYGGGVDWGDFDNDGDLDILVSGFVNATTRQLRVYRNNGNGTVNAAQIEVDGAGGGLSNGDAAWADMNNDGYLDIVAAGTTGTRQLRAYWNNGNGTFDANQTEVDGAGGGLDYANLAMGDMDKDGDLDIVISGWDGANSLTKVYWNNGDKTFNPAETLIEGATEYGLDADEGKDNVHLADYDNDGDLDIMLSGFSFTISATNAQLRIYRNNGNGTFNAAQVEVNGVNNGFREGTASWGDVDNDGDLDIVSGGNLTGGTRGLAVFRNNGSGVFSSSSTIETTEALIFGGMDLEDYDNDGDLDILVSGSDGTNPQLRLYRSSATIVGTTNLAPSAPTTLSGSWSPAATSAGMSTATFKWNAGVDNGTGASPETLLSYDIQIDTHVAFSTPFISVRYDVQPPKIYDGNTLYGVILTSTNAWSTVSNLRTDTTYYFRVRTKDASGLSSVWSSTGSVWTGTAPSSSTVSAVTGTGPGDIRLSWASAGDDWNMNNLTGNYRVQYSSNASVSWSTSTTPAGAATVTISTTNVVPGSAQAPTFTLLTNDTYYFSLWTQDDVGMWSLISNIASTQPATVLRALTLSTGTYDFGSLAVSGSSISASGVTVTNTGNVVSTFTFQAATATAGTPWSLGVTPANNTAVLYGAFHAARPTPGNFSSEDIITGAQVWSSTSVYSVDGTQTGGSVPVSGARSLWFRLDMPSASGTASPQDVNVTVTVGYGP